jgi:hypothetical protein
MERLFSQPRALIVDLIAPPKWGLGNLMPIVFAYHKLCYERNRKCLVRIQNAHLDKVFRYANGKAWTDYFPNVREDVLVHNVHGRDRLEDVLQNHNEATIIRLLLTTGMPDFRMSKNLTNENACVFKWVSRTTTRPQTYERALHLRTDWADFDERQMLASKYDFNASREWLLSACPTLIDWTERDIVTSDSPNLLQTVRAVSRSRVGKSIELKRTHSVVGNPTLRDIRIAAHDLQVFESANTVFSHSHSSFTTPSKLTAPCARFLDVKLVCPRIDIFFPRDFHKFVTHGRHVKYYPQKFLQSPCRSLTPNACLAAYGSVIGDA